MLNYIKKTFGVDDLGAKNLVIACLASLLTTVVVLFTNIALFLLLQDIVDPILQDKGVDIEVGKYIILIIVMFVALTVAVFIKYTKAYIPVYMAAAKKRIALAERIRQLPISFFGKKDIADITTTIMKDASSLEDVFSAFIPNLFSAVVSTILMCIAIFIYNIKLGMAIFWCVPISFFLTFITRKLQQSEGMRTKIINIEYLDKLQQCIDNIKDIKSNHREEYHEGLMIESFDGLEKSLRVSEFKIGTMLTCIQMILKIGMATTAIVSVNMLINGDINTLEFFIYLMIATRIYDPLLSAMINLGALFQADLSIARTKEFENIPLQVGKTDVKYKSYDIELKDVVFSYSKDKEDRDKVIDKVSLIANQGEVTALVGPSGGGKSTVLKLISRFWDINEGLITIGGEDISKIDPETLLKSISIVFQDVILFNNTVMENIRIGKRGATDEEVIEAAKKAKCHEFITRMPEGYNTLVGENGSKLSGGERQRLSIARALLKDAPIVLLDEATSSLDVKNESDVQEAIAILNKEKTVVVIAHRMRTIMNADKIIVLKEGKIVQMGEHEKLINEEGDYKRMVELQMESLNWKLS